MFVHEESKQNFRSPLGAVSGGTKIKLSFESEDICESAFLVTIYNDAERRKTAMRLASGEKRYVYETEITVKTGLYFYFFEIVGERSKELYFLGKNGYHIGESDLKLWQITVHDENFYVPSFLKGGIMYHIFVDRFNKKGEVIPREGFYVHEDLNAVPFYKPDEKGIVRNDDVYGGNLKGVIDKLDYLKSLNVTIIYLSPIFEANSNHKYNTADYMKVDSMFGSEEDFDELVKKANEMGMKIILDGVFNHTGDDSIYFNRYGKYDSVGAYQSEKSPYFDWYTFKEWNEDYECWWGIKSLPSIRKDQPIFRAFICGVGGIVEQWLKRGVSGFRIDVADELSNRMLRGINRAAKELSPENAVIGEVWEDASNKIAYGERRQYLLGKQLDSVMNYPVKDAVIEYLRTGSAKILADTMAQLVNNYPKQVLDSLMNIIGTHDTMRILTVLGTEKLDISKDLMSVSEMSEKEREKGRCLLYAASLIQFTLPGFPCVYYGDEAGLEGFADPFNRRFYPWGKEDAEILEWYKKLANIRTQNKVFEEGSFILIDEKDGVFYYAREDGKNQTVYICINLSERDYGIAEAGSAAAASVQNYRSLISGEQITQIPKKGVDIFIAQSAT